MKYLIYAIVCILVLSVPALAQDDNSPSDTVTISRDEFDTLKSKVADLELRLQQLLDKQPAQESCDAQPPATSGVRALSLPDISFIGQFKGFTSTDKSDEDRNSLRMCEGEIGFQGWVYPNLKADVFVSMSPKEDSPAQLEEAYLSYLGLSKGTNLYVGKKLVSFGRTNTIHCHSLPWVTRPLAIRNLVGEEGLSGEGAQLSYVLPTGGSLFAQMDLGFWAGGESGASSNLPDRVFGPGAAFSNRFNNARLWTAISSNCDTELELGGSYAEGDSEDVALETTGRTRLTGVDLSYRRFGNNDSRLLLRGEQFWRKDKDTNSTANGYYLYGDYRWDKYNSLGALYSWSEFPQATNLHESATSLIYTRQFSEQYYVRLQGNHGSRPNCGNYDELWLQIVWGIGPHTHNLE